MNDTHKPESEAPFTRREFMKSSALTAGAIASIPLAVGRSAHAAGSDAIRIGLVGCGGRGTGAAVNALDASEQMRIVALADVFRDRLDGCRRNLINERGERATVTDDRCYVGFDAYKELIHSDLDMVILATPPGFRPQHFAEAVKAGRHVFMEKPVGVDPVGIRTIFAAAEEADRKNLSVVAGTQRRHEACYLAAMEQIQSGAIGPVVAASCYWNQGGLWVHEKRPEWSDMEWQLRNWLYFTWLSGDHIVEQHVHNIDVVNWAVGTHPERAVGMGGRQVRTEPKYGHIFDHFAIEYWYPNDVRVTSMCRQIDGTAGRVEETIHGADGHAYLMWGRSQIKGANNWRFRGENPNPYVQEHKDLVASITGEGTHYNEARRVAESTMTAIMGRMSAYTGQDVTWEHMMKSTLDLSPERYEFGPLPTPDVAVPGRTPLV
jgi:predicted dehydrogenase